MEERPSTFRNPAGVVRKSSDATRHPDYGEPIRGNRIDLEVLQGFLAGPDEMHTLYSMTTYTPVELARELGHLSEARPEKIVRDYLRSKYPEHPKYQRWVLDEDQAADIRANAPRNFRQML